VHQVEIAATDEGVSEGLDDRRDRVGHDEGAIGVGQGRHRIDHRGRVHQQLHAELHQETQVAVLGGQRGDDHAQAEAQHTHHQQQDRQQQDSPVGAHDLRRRDEIGHETEQDGKLHAELEQPRQHHRERHDHPGEVDLPEDRGVGDEGFRGLGERLGEERPHRDPGQVEHRVRHAVRGDIGDIAEHDGEDDHHQDRLDHEPDRTQDRLLVQRHEVPSHQQQQQVAILPDLAQRHGKQSALRFDHPCPAHVFLRRGQGIGAVVCISHAFQSFRASSASTMALTTSGM